MTSRPLALSHAPAAPAHVWASVARPPPLPSAPALGYTPPGWYRIRERSVSLLAPEQGEMPTYSRVQPSRLTHPSLGTPGGILRKNQAYTPARLGGIAFSA